MIILYAFIFAVSVILLLEIRKRFALKRELKNLQTALNIYMYDLKKKHPSWNDRMIKKRTKAHFRNALKAKGLEF